MDIRSRSRQRNRIIGIALIALSALAAVYSLWPTSYRTEVFEVSSALLPHKYQLEVRYPRFGPTGENAAVEVTWSPAGTAAEFTKPGEANPVLIAEIQSSDIAFIPDGQISTPLQEGIPVHFTWEALSTTAGNGKFNLFFFKAGAEEVDGVFLQQPVWARIFPYSSFAGAGGLKIPLLFFAVLGGVFGLGLLLLNSLRQTPSRTSSRI
ncbi:MAG: hypothetical protein JW748_02905 [Anaerolineales bacterium]|nr:hypothetical protein [Anaerolineales bacterium]